jgi:hypothetical protein
LKSGFEVQGRSGFGNGKEIKMSARRTKGDGKRKGRKRRMK